MSTVFAALKARYSGNEWAFLWEVPNGTASAKQRTADALAMNLWPSRGLELHGHEVKVSRADWLKELKQPEKAEPIFKFCDRFWLVLSDPEIIRDGELPPTWGLLVLRGKSLIQKIEAPKLIDRAPVSKSFLAALLRCAVDQGAKSVAIDAVLSAKYEQGKADADRHAAMTARHAETQLKQFQDAVAVFEKESGVQISAWHAGDIGKAVNLIRQHPPGNEIQWLARVEQAAQSALDSVKAQRLVVEEILKAQQRMERKQ